MYTTFVILLSLLGIAHMQVELTASYTTSFKCENGSYALIRGDKLTLEYDYGKEHDQLQSFHLRERQRHMFDFENPTGKGIPYIKDTKFNRLKSFTWTDTGIKLVIEDISNDTDPGRYQGEVETLDGGYDFEAIKITEILAPPAEVKLTTPSGVMDSIDLPKGFTERIFNFSAVSYSAIQCNNVEITATVTDGGSRRDNSMVCSAKDAKDPTECTLTLKEADMTKGECVTVEVYAEQYGVQSDKETYKVCYEAGGMSKIILAVIIVAILAGIAFIIWIIRYIWIFGRLLIVVVVRGDLVTQQVDAIAVLTSPTLDLNQGSIAQRIQNEGGQGIQDQLKKKYPNGIAYGEVAKTDGGKLNCKVIYFGACNSSNDTSATEVDTSATENMKTFITNCLEKAHLDKLKCIAFPALGTGSRSFPPSLSASLIYECVLDFKRKHRGTRLSEVKVVVDDNDIIQKEFEKQLPEQLKKKSWGAALAEASCCCCPGNNAQRTTNVELKYKPVPVDV